MTAAKRGFWDLLAHDDLSRRAEAFLMCGAALLGAAVPLVFWAIS